MSAEGDLRVALPTAEIVFGAVPVMENSLFGNICFVSKTIHRTDV